MEIKRVHKFTSLSNNESQHQERKRYDPIHLKPISKASKEEGEIPTKEEVKEIIKEINAFLKKHETSVQYEYHEKLNEYFVKIVDKGTNEIIREIPPKKLLDLYAYMKEKVGLIIDKKA